MSHKDRSAGKTRKVIKTVRKRDQKVKTNTTTVTRVVKKKLPCPQPLVKKALPCSTKKGPLRRKPKPIARKAKGTVQNVQKVVEQVSRTWSTEKETTVTTEKTHHQHKHHHHKHHHHHHHHKHHHHTKPACPHHHHKSCEPKCEKCHCETCTCDGKVDDLVIEEASQIEEVKEGIYQLVVIRDSENIQVDLASLQAAINLQAALQLAITLVLNIALAGTDEETNLVGAQLTQFIRTKQNVRSTIEIEDSKNVNVEIASAEVSANIELLLQVLLALIAKLEIA